MNTQGNADADVMGIEPVEPLHVEASLWRSQLLATPDDSALGARLDAWLARSTAHRLAYAEVADLEFLLRLLPPGRSLPVVTSSRPRRLVWSALQACAALLIVAWGWLNLPGLWENWRADRFTVVGQIGRYVLPDGSMLVLDSDSAVQWHMDAGQREVELKRGAAYVQVLADPARPFVVRTPVFIATALGTAYSVEFDSGRVSVEHGRVRVSGGTESLELGAGQTALPTTTGWQLSPSAAEAPDWTRGHRSFAQRPLREVLSVIDRYLPGGMWLRETSVLDEPVTAVLDLADPALALAQLCAAHGLQVQSWPGLIVIAEQ